MWYYVALVKANISEERITSIIKVESQTETMYAFVIPVTC
jgi:hypothetical protein